MSNGFALLLLCFLFLAGSVQWDERQQEEENLIEEQEDWMGSGPDAALFQTIWVPHLCQLEMKHSSTTLISNQRGRCCRDELCNGFHDSVPAFLSVCNYISKDYGYCIVCTVFFLRSSLRSFILYLLKPAEVLYCIECICLLSNVREEFMAKVTFSNCLLNPYTKKWTWISCMIFLFLTFTFEPEAVMLTHFNDFFLKCLHSVCFIFIGCPFFQSLFVSRTGSVLFGALFINDPVSFLAAVKAHNQTVTHSAASLNSPARLPPPPAPAPLLLSSLGFHEASQVLCGTSPAPGLPAVLMALGRCHEQEDLGDLLSETRCPQPASCRAQQPDKTSGAAVHRRSGAGGFKTCHEQQQSHQFRDWRMGLVKMLAFRVIPRDFWLLRRCARACSQQPPKET